MPYKSIQEAEKKNPGLKKYSEKAKRGWIGSFNSCMADGGPEDKCFAIAYSVSNKVDGRKPKKSSDDEWVARELLKVAKDIEAADRIALNFIEEARAVKMKAYVNNFFGDVKKFKGSLNDFLRKLPNMVDNPRALAEFPELENIINLSRFMSRNVMRGVMLSPGELTDRMMQVVTVDAR